MQTTELLSQLYVCHEFTIHAAISLTYSRTQSVTLTHLLAHTLTHSLTHTHSHLFTPYGSTNLSIYFCYCTSDGMAVSSIYGVGTAHSLCSHSLGKQILYSPLLLNSHCIHQSDLEGRVELNHSKSVHWAVPIPVGLIPKNASP